MTRTTISFYALGAWNTKVYTELDKAMSVIEMCLLNNLEFTVKYHD